MINNCREENHILPNNSGTELFSMDFFSLDPNSDTY